MFAAAILGPLFSAVGLALVGAATLLGLMLLPSGSPGKENDGLRLLMAIVGWVLLAVGGFAFFGLAMPWMLGVLFCASACVVMVMAFTRRRDVQRQALLETLAAAAQQGLPLAPAASAFGQETWGSVGSRARQLAAALDCGRSLPEALIAVGGLVKRPTLAMLQAGHELQVTDAALQATAAEDDQESIVGDVVVQALYLSGLMLFTAIVLTFFMIKIVPAFKTIFVDFETELPAMTQVLIDASVFIGDYAWAWLPVLPLLVLLFAYLLLMYIGWIEPRLPFGDRLVDLVSVVYDSLGWLELRLPFSDRFTASFDAPQILRTLALGAAAGLPLERTLAVLAGTYHKRFIRNRLKSILGDVRLGNDWCDCLLRHRIVTSVDHGLLKAASLAGNLSWAFREAAANSRRRGAYWLNNVIQIVTPLLIVGMSMVVAFIVVALFMPLIKIIEALT